MLELYLVSLDCNSDDLIILYDQDIKRMRKYEENLCEVSKHCGWKLNLEFHVFAQPRAVRLRKPTQLLKRMQRLLDDHADNSFLRELFLQRLPANMRMVLASTPDTSNLDKLAEMADKIMEVATPAVSSVATPTDISTEVEQLRVELSRLDNLVSSLVAPARLLVRHPTLACLVALLLLHHAAIHPIRPHPPFAGTMPSMVIRPGNANNPAPKCQTTRPLGDGDRYSWP